jgi:hypothetical protein
MITQMAHVAMVSTYSLQVLISSGQWGLAALLKLSLSGRQGKCDSEHHAIASDVAESTAEESMLFNDS